MRFCCLVVSLFLLPGFGFAEADNPAATPVSKSPVVLERRLSSSEACTIEIRATNPLSITMRIGGKDVVFPPECLADLSDCNVPDGVQVADFMDEVYVLLAGGDAQAPWHAKLVLRGNHVVGRELYRGDEHVPQVLSIQSAHAAPTATSVPATGSTVLEFPAAKPISKGEKAP